jgi:hypothetical protein
MMPAMTDELLARAELFERAVNERDRAIAEAVLHEDYALQLVQPATAVMPRARWLEVLPEYVVHEWRVEDRIADVTGEVACVLQRVEMRATVLGEDRSGTFVITDTWLRGPDGWRVWRRHSTPLSAPQMPG